MKKNGVRNNIQRYKCLSCNKTFTFQKKLNSSDTWRGSSQEKQTYKERALKYKCSVKTIQRHIDKAPKTALKPPISTYLNIIMDTTFFGREFGVLVIMDSSSEKVVYHQIVSTERDEYYQNALNSLREKGYIIQSITCDGRRGLLKDLFDTPTQMCHFHMVAIVMRKLRKKHKSIAGKELKILVKTLKESLKNEFYRRLHYWYLKHQDYLNERSDKCNERGYFPYKHKGLRGTLASLKYHEKYLFAFEKHPEFNIEKTTNRLEGLFSELKRKLINHNGLSKKRKIVFIKDFLNNKSC
ncbi:IS256 family transposase, variant Zn-binding type [Pasteurella sp. PK-2025]|uniref:IS256 family transposase, variant Zn-binding type n=1 Tax=Pasteurella sp. PK-2025 TaxID=3413133 RepID=UPI003C747132